VKGSPATPAPRATTPAAWALSAVLCAVHAATGAWALSTRRVPDAWAAFVGERPAELRVLLGDRDSARVAAGELWRLVTGPFVHASGLFLLINVVALLALGQIVETRLGAKRWLVVFLLGAVGGGLVSQLSGVVRTDGASGGAYALLGAAIAWGRWAPDLDDDERRWLVRVLGAFAAANVVWSLVDPRLDAAAHVGGLGIGAWLVWRWMRGARTQEGLG
jgi:membrane associated rhomboid family serine protease